MKRLYKYITLFLLTMGVTQVTKAQYPVQVVPTIMSPASLNLSDYYTGTIPKLTVSVTNRDLQQPMLNVRLRVSISNNSIQLKTDETKSYVPVMLTPGVPTRLSGAALAQYLNPENLIFQGFTKQEYLQTGQLPEGLYNFCFQVIEVNTNRVLSRANSCALAWISKTEPPLLNTPFNRAKVVSKNPAFIPFNWTPRHRNSANNAVNTSYEFELVELLDNKVDPNAGFASSRVLYKTSVSSSTLLYGPSQPQLIMGKRYAWRVRAVPTDPTKEYDEFRNNGYSDIYSFYYTEDLPPFEIEEFTIENNELALNWNKVKDFEGLYHVQFEHNGALSQKVITSTNSYSLSDVSNELYPDIQITSNGNKRIYAYVSYFATSGEIIAEDVYRVDVGNIDPNAGPTKTYRKPGDTTNYVPGDKTPATKVLASRSALFQGRIQWAYFNSSDLKTSIRTIENSPEVSKVLTKNDSPKEKFPLEGATVKLYFEKGGIKSLVKTVKTDDYGHYKIPVVKEDGGKYLVQIEHRSGLFSNSQAYTGLELNKINKDSKYIGYSDHTVFLNNAELDVNIFAPQLEQSEVEGFTAEVYLESNKFKNTYGKVVGQLNYEGGTELNHNRSTFKKIGELTNSSGFVKVLPNQNNITSYLIVLTRTGYPSKILTVGAPNMFMRSTHTIKYEVTPALYGRVTANNKTLAQSNVAITIKKQDVRGEVTGGYESGNTVVFNQLTDYNGDYSIEIPLLKEGAQINVVISNRLASPRAYVGKLTIGKKVRNEFNHDFRNTTHTFVGQITKADGTTPLSGVMISHPGSGQSIRSTNDGYFLLQLKYKTGDLIKIKADGFKPQDVLISSLEKVDLSLPANASEKTKAAESWSATITKQTWVKDYLKANVGKVADAGMFKAAFSGKQLKMLYGQMAQNDLEAIGGIVPVGVIKMAPNDILVSMGIEVDGNSKPGRIQIFKDDVLFQEIKLEKAGDKGLFKGPAGYYKIKVSPLEGQEQDFTPYKEDMRLISSLPGRRYGMSANDLVLDNVFEQQQNKFVPLEMAMYLSAQNDDKEIIFKPRAFRYEVTFAVVTKKDGKPIKDAKVYIEDVQQGNGGTDKEGKITIFRGATSAGSCSFKVSKAKYNAVVKMVEYSGQSKINVNIELKKSPDIKIKTIGGFPVKIIKILEDPSDKANWIVSGTMDLPDNDIFKADKQNKTAEFKDVFITLEDQRTGAMVPIKDFDLESSVVRGTAYGAYTIEIENLKMVKASGSDDYVKAILKAARVKVLLSGNTKGSKSVKNVIGKMGPGAWLMQKKDRTDGELITGEISSVDGTDNLTSITTVFDAPPIEVKDLTMLEKSFGLKFEDGATVDLDIMGEIKFKVSTTSASIDYQGITLGGELPIPSVFKSDKAKFPIKNIRINKSFQGIDVIFNVSDDDPFEMRIQKINSSLTGLTLNNLGSVNCGIDISGLVWLNEKDGGKRGNVLVIDFFKLDKIDNGFKAWANFKVEGGEGIKVKGLSFNTEGGSGIGFAFDTDKETFEFNVGGTVKYEGGGAAAKKVFGEDGITVDFRLRTKDWAFLMKAQRDIEITFGVVTVEINTFLLNVGYGVDLDAMSDMMVKREKKAATPSDGFEEPDQIKTGAASTLVLESKTDWAIGVAGGLKFPIKKLDVGLSGRFVIGYIDNDLKFKLDSIDLSIKTPAAEVAVAASLEITESATEFKGSGKFTVMGTGLSTGFSYKQTSSYYEVKANLMVQVSAPIITGPVGWLAIGGGFEVNLPRNEAGDIDGLGKLGVYLKGQVTTAGGSRQTMYMDVIKLGVEYNGTKKCNEFGIPVMVDGQANLMIKEESWAEVKANLDFCYHTFSLTIDARVPEMVKGMPNIQATGILFGAGPRKHYGGLFYLGINATLNAGILNGKANIAFGANVNKNHPSLTPDVLTSLDKLDQEVMQKYKGATYFHGVVVDGAIILPSDHKKFDVDIGPLPKFGLEYHYGGSVKAKVFVNFIPETAKPKEFKVEGTLDLDAAASAYISTFRISGSIDVYAHMVGGYTEARDWYANGNFNAKLQASAGSKTSSGCRNKFGLSWEDIYESVWKKLIRTVNNTDYAMGKSCEYRRPCDRWCWCCCGGTVHTTGWTEVKNFVKSVSSKVGVQVCVDVKGSFEVDKNKKSFEISKK